MRSSVMGAIAIRMYRVGMPFNGTFWFYLLRTLWTLNTVLLIFGGVICQMGNIFALSGHSIMAPSQLVLAHCSITFGTHISGQGIPRDQI